MQFYTTLLSYSYIHTTSSDILIPRSCHNLKENFMPIKDEKKNIVL
jgi:hypothetical protein